MRKRVYPNFISSGRMTKTKSEHEIECMERIRDVLIRLKNEEPPCDCDILQTCEKCR